MVTRIVGMVRMKDFKQEEEVPTDAMLINFFVMMPVAAGVSLQDGGALVHSQQLIFK